MRASRSSIAVLLSVVSALACTAKSSPPVAQAAPPAAPSQPAMPAASPGSPASPASPGANATASAFPSQPGWVVETPTSGMRKAQFRLPRAEGDADDASLVVYYFGGQAGTLQANLDRWCGQFEQPDQRPSAEVMKSSQRAVNGITVHEVDLSGNYVAETAPGSGERVHKDGWRMLAAVFEAKDGPYYAKLVGPAKTIGHWEPSFRTFVEAARPGGS